MAVQQVILQHILNAPPVKPAASLHVAIITDGNGPMGNFAGITAVGRAPRRGRGQPGDH
jgi:hypothetical protein